MATDPDERNIDALETLLNLPDVFATSDPEDDGEDDADENYAWRRVLRREEDRRFDHSIGNHLDAARQRRAAT